HVAERRAVSAPGVEPAATREDRALDLSGMGERFTVEIADSTSARYARTMVNELKQTGQAAYVVAPAAGAGSYHLRVRLYPTRAEADRSARTLEKTLGWRLSVMSTTTEAALVARGTPVSYSR